MELIASWWVYIVLIYLTVFLVQQCKLHGDRIPVVVYVSLLCFACFFAFSLAVFSHLEQCLAHCIRSASIRSANELMLSDSLQSGCTHIYGKSEKTPAQHTAQQAPWWSALSREVWKPEPRKAPPIPSPLLPLEGRLSVMGPGWVVCSSSLHCYICD